MEALDRLLGRLRLAAEATQAAKDRVLVDSGLTKAQYNALLLLSQGAGATATQLANACGMSQQAMSKTVSRLVSAGFVAASPSPHGGRSRVLEVTERGQASLAVADAAVASLDQALRDFLDPLPQEDFFTALERITTAAKSAI